MKQSKRSSPALRPTAFTMIEMLIAITIVLVLVGIMVAAMAPALTGARETATKAIIAQLDGQLKSRMTAFNALENKELVKRLVATGVNEADAKVLVKKIRYRIEFPQRVEDLDSNFNGIPNSVLKTAVANKSNVSSSELLYLLLTEGRALGSESYSIDGISSQFITDEDNDGLMEIRDAWGNEIRFYASPTALFRPNPSMSDPDNASLPRLDLTKGARVLFGSIPGDDGTATPSAGELYQDPFDKLGRLVGVSQATAANYYYPMTQFSYLIVSAGPDGELGLTEPTATGMARHAQPVSATNLDPIFDNITNHQN